MDIFTTNSKPWWTAFPDHAKFLKGNNHLPQELTLNNSSISSNNNMINGQLLQIKS